MCGVAGAGLMLAAGVLAAGPDEPKAARDRHAAAVAEAREAFAVRLREAAEYYANEIARLRDAATKSGRLDQAVALREAAKLPEGVAPVGEWLKEKRRFKAWWGDEFYEFGPAGWSVNGEAKGGWAAVNHDSIRLWTGSERGKGNAGTWTFSHDRSRALVADIHTGVMTAVK